MAWVPYFPNHGNDSFPTHRGKGLAIKPPTVSHLPGKRELKWAFTGAHSFSRKLCRILGKDFKYGSMCMHAHGMRVRMKKKTKQA